MEDYKKKSVVDGDKEIVFSKAIKAGKQEERKKARATFTVSERYQSIKRANGRKCCWWWLRSCSSPTMKAKINM